MRPAFCRCAPPSADAPRLLPMRPAFYQCAPPPNVHSPRQMQARGQLRVWRCGAGRGQARRLPEQPHVCNDSGQRRWVAACSQGGAREPVTGD
eukprot:363177-Chlamydomonas_euryale.AAC.1